MDNTQQATISLGKRLRQLTSQSRANAEVTRFIEILEEAANKGEDHVTFTDLRQVLPTMILNDTIWDWLRANELGASGVIDNNTAEYKYTISW